MSRVLLVEDDPHILRVMSMWLSQKGHELFEASNGAIGLQLYREHRPHIVITDINMPVMDGLQLLEEIFQEAYQPRGIVMLTSRWDHREIAEKFFEQGVRVFPKPFSPSKFAELITELDAPIVEMTDPTPGAD